MLLMIQLKQGKKEGKLDLIYGMIDKEFYYNIKSIDGIVREINNLFDVRINALLEDRV